MPVHSLARTYRPAAFAEMIGQRAVVTTLTNALKLGKIHPAYIFSGIRGVGKTTAARLFARGLNCAEGTTPEPCGECPSCLEIPLGRSMDVLEIDGATHTGADEVRDLTQAARYMPVRDRYRVFVIDEVHMLSKQAFNALLKTLEEPPPHAVFLLATTEPGRIPETIHSRAHHFRFRRVPTQEVAAFLRRVCEKEKAAVDDAALDLLARSGEGSVRDSLTLLDRLLIYADNTLDEATAAEALGVEGREALLGVLARVGSGDVEGVTLFVDELRERGRDLERFLGDLVELVRRVLRVKVSGAVSRPEGGDPEDGALAKLAESSSLEDLMRLSDLLVETQRRMRGAPDPDTLFELQMVKAAMLPSILPLDRLLEAIDRTPKTPAPSADQADGSAKSAPAQVQKEEDLTFKALIPFERMSEEEARSYVEDPRFSPFVEAVAKAMPLLRPTLKETRLSLDPEGVIHLRLPPGSTTAAALLAKPEALATLKALARREGLPETIQVQNGGASRTETPPPENKGAGKDPVLSKPVETVVRVLGGKVISTRSGVSVPPAGGEDGEPE